MKVFIAISVDHTVVHQQAGKPVIETADNKLNRYVKTEFCAHNVTIDMLQIGMTLITIYAP